MRVFVYEYITGGGWLEQPELPPATLWREGAAMVAALAADFAILPEVEVCLLHDARWPRPQVSGCRVHDVGSAAEERARFEQLVNDSEWTVVIAPELGGALVQRCELVEQLGGRLLGPSVPLVQLGSDKHAAAQHLLACGVPAPRGIRLEAGQRLPRGFDYPAVLKPLDGAGSQGVRFIPSPVEGATVKPDARPARLERFCRGLPASVAALCGPKQQWLLPPCRQQLAGDGTFAYLGGSLPLPEALARRAARLAHAALAAISRLALPLGYLGIDLVLGVDPAGHDDVVIELNPRLTTSYVGLRALARGNLAEAMLHLATGLSADLAFGDGPLAFSAGGEVWRAGDDAAGWACRTAPAIPPRPSLSADVPRCPTSSSREKP
jgi:predicted ATP-grasp superfamily ATP-dependent carboligase